MLNKGVRDNHIIFRHTVGVFRGGAGLLFMMGVVLFASVANAAAVKILSINIAGNEHVPARKIIDALPPTAHRGHVVADAESVLELIESKVRSMGYFSEVQARPEFTDTGMKITIDVRERPRVKRVVFKGNTVLSDEKLMEVVYAHPGIYISGGLLERDATRITRAYRKAKSLATVREKSVDDAGVITFEIAEAHISRVNISGLRVVRKSEVLKKAGIAGGDVFVMDRLADGLEKLRNAGWFRTIDVKLQRESKGEAVGIVVKLQVEELPGIFPRRIGPGKEDIDRQQLRDSVSLVGLDLGTTASVHVNDHLLAIDGDVPTAVSQLEQAAAGDNARPEVILKYAQILKAIGRREQAHQQFTRATDAYRKQLEGHPKDAEVLTHLGVCLMGKGEFKQACDVLGEAMENAVDDWRPKPRFALAAGNYVLSELSKGVAADNMTEQGTDVAGCPAFRALAELMLWERTREILVEEAADGELNSDLMSIAVKARKSLQRVLNEAPQNPEVITTTCRIAFSALSMIPGSDVDSRRVLKAAAEDVEQFFRDRSEACDEHPSVALWAAFLNNPDGVLTLVASTPPTATEDQVRGQLQNLGKRLDSIVNKWPRVLRTSGRIIGLLQLLSDSPELAQDTFEKAIEQNPYNRQNYNALLGMALENRNWERMTQLVRKRLKYNPSAEDYVLLGKIDSKRSKQQEAKKHFQTAIDKFSDAAIGYMGLAGWLLRTKENDARADKLIENALQLAPQSGYAYALQTVVHLLNDERQKARSQLKKALMNEPRDELANTLRNRYFPPRDDG